ncbi:AAA family ATPase [Jonesiaceae bacterium BS-20]|uniref:AAA family ATPase n=1 Tax=Jonesiaceae bacterium BS-20 TaxID=3120821 RepID=A0AAU7DZ01_9MICO
MLLNFAVRNFRCFSDEAQLSLTSPSLRTNIPRKGQTWIEATERVAAIFGPNASGKTTILDAIHAVAIAVLSPGAGTVFQPTLSRSSDSPATEYAIDFISGDVRYQYEIRASRWGISWEALYSFPKGTRRTVFTRFQEERDSELEFTKGSSLVGPTAEVLRITKPTMLFMSTAHKYGHKALSSVARTLVADVGINFVSFRDTQDETVLQRVVMEMVADPGNTQVDLVKALVQAADLGIERVEIQRETIDEKEYEWIVRMVEALNDGTERSKEDIPRLRDAVVFFHRSEEGEEFKLPVQNQSAGTITWLTTAWHALKALRAGSVLLIDELDASLHPELARYVVELFQTPHFNQHGAQLIFTSHDISLLGNAPTRLLQPRNVWFTEKKKAGQSELFSMSEFDNRAGNNDERRYMAGQFGALPDIDDHLLIQFVASEAAEDPVDV